MQQRAFGSEGANWPGTRQDVTAMSRPPMYEAMPITRPPAPGAYTAAPSAPPGGWQMQNMTSLLGLESLMHLDRIYIDQHLEPLEIFTGFHGKNKYTMLDASGQPVFHMREESSAINRMCCGSAREFKIKAFDNSGQEVFRLESPVDLFLRRIDVYASNRLIGTIQQSCSWFKVQLEVKDSQGTSLFQIEGPGCTCSCFSSIEYQVFTADKVQQIGLISREWPGLSRALFTKADVFGVSFPRDLDVYQKVLLIGSTILIDFAMHEGE